MSRVRIIGGYRRIADIQREYEEELREYNDLIRRLGFYLKPTHVVVVKGRKYVYHGRYWWKIVHIREGGRTKIKWKYLGKNVCENVPKPPLNPLEGLSYVKENDDIILNMNSFLRFKHLFHGLKIVFEK